MMPVLSFKCLQHSSSFSEGCTAKDKSELVNRALPLNYSHSVFSSLCFSLTNSMYISSVPLSNNELLNMKYPSLDSLGSQTFCVCAAQTLQFVCVNAQIVC